MVASFPPLFDMQTKSSIFTESAITSKFSIQGNISRDLIAKNRVSIFQNQFLRNKGPKVAV